VPRQQFLHRLKHARPLGGRLSAASSPASGGCGDFVEQPAQYQCQPRPSARRDATSASSAVRNPWRSVASRAPTKASSSAAATERSTPGSANSVSARGPGAWDACRQFGGERQHLLQRGRIGAMRGCSSRFIVRLAVTLPRFQRLGGGVAQRRFQRIEPAAAGTAIPGRDR